MSAISVDSGSGDELDSADERWRASESPEEDFGDADGANEDGEWPVEIIGEEVGYNNKIRYEKRWENWKRKDGTNVTWDNDPAHEQLVGRWNASQGKRRSALASESRDIDIWSSTDILSTKTRLRAQAYDIKLKKYKQPPPGLVKAKTPDPRAAGPSGLQARTRSMLSFQDADISVKTEEDVDMFILPSSRASSTAVASTITRPSPAPSSTSTRVQVTGSRKGKSKARDEDAVLRRISTPPRQQTPPQRRELEALWAQPPMRADQNEVAAMRSPGFETSPERRPFGEISQPRQVPLQSGTTSVPRAVDSPAKPRPKVASTPGLQIDPIMPSSSSFNFKLISSTLPSVDPQGRTRERDARYSTPQIHASSTQLISRDFTLIPQSASKSSSSTNDSVHAKLFANSQPNAVASGSKKLSTPTLTSKAISQPSPTLSAKGKGKGKSTFDCVKLPLLQDILSSSKKSTPSNELPASPTSYRLGPKSQTSKGKEKASATPPQRAPSLSRPVMALPPRAAAGNVVRTKRLLSELERMQDEWTKAAHSCNAERITFVNDVDDEIVPNLGDGFVYLEASYLYDEDVPRPPDDGFFTGCECMTCDSPLRCEGCQDVSDLVDIHGKPQFAYTEDGLFTGDVPRGVEVVECNRCCSCGPDCMNRVAQRPRQVPVEIFKTRECGWGVRSPKDVEEGRVLGIYTGLLIPRSTAEDLVGEEKAYCFDLDSREDPQEPAPEEAYTVNSKHCGNWTRFINHSCSPNLAVYMVVYDTIPSMFTPYIVFYATKDIRRGTEFTFDYDPSSASTSVSSPIQKRRRSRGKNKKLIPKNAPPCRCGADNCRGWVRVD